MGLCKCNGMAELETCPSSYVLPCRIWSFCVKGCRHNKHRTPKTGQPWSSAVRMRDMADPKIHTPLPHYHVKFGSSASKGVTIDRRNPKIGVRWGPTPLGWGIAHPLKTSPLPTCHWYHDITISWYHWYHVSLISNSEVLHQRVYA